jgi:hypothetical protein
VPLEVRSECGGPVEVFSVAFIDKDISIGVNHCELAAVVVVLEVGLDRGSSTMGTADSTCIFNRALGLDYDLPRIIN